MTESTYKIVGYRSCLPDDNIDLIVDAPMHYAKLMMTVIRAARNPLINLSEDIAYQREWKAYVPEELTEAIFSRGNFLYFNIVPSTTRKAYG